MFKTSDFDVLINQTNGIDKIRAYPAINTHNDANPDTLTLILVPVSGTSGDDKLNLFLYEFADLCPSKCNYTGTYAAPTRGSLELDIPKSWCIRAEDIASAISQGEVVVGSGNVYGIRFYWYVNGDGIMDLELKPTTESGGYINDIGTIALSGVTQICNDGEGCCDTESALYNPEED